MRVRVIDDNPYVCRMGGLATHQLHCSFHRLPTEWPA